MIISAISTNPLDGPSPMNRSTRFPAIAIAVTLLPIACSGTAEAASILVTVTPSATQVDVGETFTVSLTASIIDAADADFALSAWGLDLPFDDTLVDHDADLDVSIDSAWNAFSEDSDGLGGWQLPSFDDPPPQLDIALGEVTFTATASGTLVLDPSFDEFVEGFVFLRPDGTPVAAEDVLFIGATVQIIPLPPAIGLGLAGLISVGLLRRRMTR